MWTQKVCTISHMYTHTHTHTHIHTHTHTYTHTHVHTHTHTHTINTIQYNTIQYTGLHTYYSNGRISDGVRPHGRGIHIDHHQLTMSYRQTIDNILCCST